MNRWAARIVGILLLLAVGLVFMQMYRTLVKLQQQRPAATTTAR